MGKEEKDEKDGNPSPPPSVSHTKNLPH